MNIAIVPAFQVDAIWPRLAKGFQRGCDRCENGIEAGILWQRCRSGQAFLIVAYEDDNLLAGSCWSFEEQDQRVVFRCLSLTGHGIKSWLADMRAFTTRIAKENGASALVAEGRKGWMRMFPDAIENSRDYEVAI